MGIYVPNMKMPSECRSCLFTRYDSYSGTTWCEVSVKKLADNFKPIQKDGKAEWCELEELPLVIMGTVK